MLSVKNKHLKCYPSSLGKEDEAEDEDILMIREILLTHDPDGRRIDSHTLLRVIENVMCYATATTTTVSQTLLEALALETDLRNIQVDDSHEALGQTIHKISCEILCGDGDLHMRTMSLFDLLVNFKWDAKVVLVLAAFAMSYGEFWLLLQLYPINPLAVSIAMLKQLPKNLDIFKLRFKALSLLVKTMVDVTKCIIEFEGLPMQHIKLDNKALSTTKSQIYIAAYWIIRSTLTSSSLVTDLTAMNYENSSSTTIATWELSSLVYKVNGIYRRLQRQVDECRLQIEDKLHKKLLHLFEFEETHHINNQEVLGTLFSLKDDLPFKDGSSKAKLGVSELINKEVVLLLSKPEILPIEELLFLVQQTCGTLPDEHDKTERSYEFVWVPISSSGTWTEEEEKIFDYLSNSLPWYSICQPWLLSPAVVNYFKQVWNFVDEPLMVVLDLNGRVTSSNAINMVYIWGADMAYPFSTSREQQLWEEANWSLQLLVDEIDPLISKQVEEGRTFCLYGSNDMEWIREFTSEMKKLKKAGVQLELTYVGKRRSCDQHLSNIISTISQEKLSSYLSYPKMHFFWIRLECMKRSKLKLSRHGNIITTADDLLLQNVVSLLNFDENDKSWVLMGEGFSNNIVELHRGRKAIECLKLFQVWGEHIEKVGFMGVLRRVLEPPLSSEPCHCYRIVTCVDGSSSRDERSLICEECKLPMEKLIVYECNNVTE